MNEDISFSWDSEKNKRNMKKHSVSFEEAVTVFYDEEALVIYDDKHSETEDRFVIIGTSNLLRTLVVCHCFRHEARKANIEERKQYERSIRRRQYER